MPNANAALLALACASVLVSCALPGTTGPDRPAPTQDASSKSERVSGELVAIYAQRYSGDHLESRVCSDADRAQDEADRSIVVDALAKEDADLLLKQLTSLGLTHAQVAAPVVSGYFPICAIPELETCCSELKFIRQSISENRAP